MNVFINNATNDLHCGLNSLLADFSHCDSVTLSTLFKTYCIQLKKFIPCLHLSIFDILC